MRTAMHTGFLACLLIAISSLPGLAADDPVAEARTAIEKSNAKFSEAVRKGDGATIAGLYSKDAIVFPPDAEMVKGREAIAKFWSEQMAGGIKDARLKTIDVESSGDIAVETGTVELTVQPKGKEETHVAAKYVVAWKRGGRGVWRLHRDIWNGLPAAAAK